MAKDINQIRDMFFIFKNKEQKLLDQNIKKALPIISNNPAWVPVKTILLTAGAVNHAQAKLYEKEMAKMFARFQIKYLKENGCTQTAEEYNEEAVMVISMFVDMLRKEFSNFNLPY